MDSMGETTSGACGGDSASASVGTFSRAMPASSTWGLNVIRPLSLMAPHSSTVAPQEEALASISDLAGTHLSETQLDELMDSKEVQKNTLSRSSRWLILCVSSMTTRHCAGDATTRKTTRCAVSRSGIDPKQMLRDLHAFVHANPSWKQTRWPKMECRWRIGTMIICKRL